MQFVEIKIIILSVFATDLQFAMRQPFGQGQNKLNEWPLAGNPLLYVPTLYKEVFKVQLSEIRRLSCAISIHPFRSFAIALALKLTKR